MEIKSFFDEITSDDIEFVSRKKERELSPILKENVRKRKDGYFSINIPMKDGNRIAIVPRNTIENLLNEGTSLRVLKDRCNTLSALTQTFDKPLMYYAIIAYNLVPKEEWQEWKTSTPLLNYELIHLNGNIDDIRKENVRLALRDEKVWKRIKDEYKSKGERGADLEYQKAREEFLRQRLEDYPDLKVMTRVTDCVKKKTSTTKKFNKELTDTIS